MTPSEARGLAAATSCWLAYRDLIGLGGTLYESLMLVPITEYLARSWVIETELSYRRVFGNQLLPDQYADIVATKKSGSRKLIIETKILRSSISQNIVEDIYKLAAPKGDVIRYFVLSGKISNFGSAKEAVSPADASLFDRLFRYSYNEGFNLPSLVESSAAFPISKPTYLRRCAEERAPLNERDAYKTVIWSIGAPSELTGDYAALAPKAHHPRRNDATDQEGGDAGTESR